VGTWFLLTWISRCGRSFRKHRWRPQLLSQLLPTTLLDSGICQIEEFWSSQGRTAQAARTDCQFFFQESHVDPLCSGLEADQKVIAVHGCYAMTATTALTAQNTLDVQDIHHTPPEFVRKQLNACLDDVGADVVKMGEPRIFIVTQSVFLMNATLKGCLPRQKQWMLLQRCWHSIEYLRW